MLHHISRENKCNGRSGERGNVGEKKKVMMEREELCMWLVLSAALCYISSKNNELVWRKKENIKGTDMR